MNELKKPTVDHQIEIIRPTRPWQSDVTYQSKCDGVLSGCIDLMMIPDDYTPYHNGEFRLNRVVVRAQFRGMGVGSKMLGALCADADAAEKTLVLEAIPYTGGERARGRLRKFYASFGFVQIPDLPDDCLGMMRRGYQQCTEEQ